MELDYAPFTPFMVERMPGMSPLSPSEWLHRDEAFAPQMAYRDHLVASEQKVVLAGEGCHGAAELLALVCATLDAHDPDYEVEETRVRRPDGAVISLDQDKPFATLARLVQEDLLILERPEDSDEHILIGAALLFPSRWSLQEKMHRPLVGIHERVPSYDSDIAPRVQRLFDALRVDRPLVRANWMVHPVPELHQPVHYDSSKKPHAKTGVFWLRVERQSLVKLPVSGCVVFSVKTCVTPITALDQATGRGLIAALQKQTPAMREYHGGGEHNDTAIAAISSVVSGQLTAP